MLRVG
ncbi:MAG: hypothetical protein RJB47_1108, partial [Pseudomonadota bacterium]